MYILMYYKYGLQNCKKFPGQNIHSHITVSLAVVFAHSRSSPTLLSACFGEQAAAIALGYTQVSWDNLSGKELQPWSSIKSWAALGDTERAGARILGYTSSTTWDNESGLEPRPASAFKSWSELGNCSDGEDRCKHHGCSWQEFLFHCERLC